MHTCSRGRFSRRCFKWTLLDGAIEAAIGAIQSLDLDDLLDDISK